MGVDTRNTSKPMSFLSLVIFKKLSFFILYNNTKSLSYLLTAKTLQHNVNVPNGPNWVSSLKLVIPLVSKHTG